jgi:hypothetical protein
MITPGTKLGLRFGLWAAGLHLTFALFIWFVVVGSVNGEGWFYVGLLHLPSLFVLSRLFPNFPAAFPHLSDAAWLCGCGTITWFVCGWMIGRIVMFYRDHS